MIAVIARQRVEDTWSYGMLYDLRRVPTRGSLLRPAERSASMVR
jgi:hypothetical protein